MVRIIKKLLKTLAVLLTIVVAELIVAHFSAQSMIKPTELQQQIVTAIRQQTSMTASIEEEMTFSLLPLPKLVVKNLKLENGAVIAPSIPHFSVERIEISIAPLSLFSSKMEISEVRLINPLLELERADDNTIHWAWLNTTVVNLLRMQLGELSSLPLVIVGGVIRYQDTANNQNIVLGNIQGAGLVGPKFQLGGQLKLNEQALVFDLDNNPADGEDGAKALFLNLQLAANNSNVVRLHGAVTPSADSFKITGKFNADTDNLEQWLPAPASEKNASAAMTNTPLTEGEGENAANIKPPVPFSISGDWGLNASVVGLQNLSLKGANSEGVGSAKIYWEHWYPTIDANLKLASLDYSQWQKLLAKIVADPQASQDGQVSDQQLLEVSQNFNFHKESALPANITINLKMDVQKLLVEGNAWSQARLDAVMDAGSITVNQCDIGLPEDGLASIFGVISQGGNGALKFEGNLEVKGNSLHDALAMAVPSTKDFPSIGMGDFSAYSNLYIAPGQVRLSEMDATLQDTKLGGAVMVYLDAVPRVEAKIKAKELNFDYVRDTLRQKKNAADQAKKAGNIGENINRSFGWLRDLGVRLDASVSVGKFTFLERQGDSASFSVYAYDGDFKLYDMELKYPDYTTDFNFSLNVKYAQPTVKITLSGDQIDTPYPTR